MAGEDSRRIAFTIQYDGAPYFGWQLQRGRQSVQGEIEVVLDRLFAEPTRVIGAGRTDRGVHATGQVAAVNAPGRWEPAELRRAMNALLPESIWISHAAEVAPDFHPRYGATARRYVYRLGLAEVAASPFHARWCWARCRPVDLVSMELATLGIIGDHSFRAFAKAGQEERGDRCAVTEATWMAWGSIGLELRITANRFLHHMVRYLVGTIVEVGIGRRSPDDVARLLRGEPGLVTSPPAPPHGLYLAEVRYPDGVYPASNDPAVADQERLPSTFT